jgi:hypothetical protein
MIETAESTELGRLPFELVLRIWSRCDPDAAVRLVVALPRLARALWADVAEQGFSRLFVRPATRGGLNAKFELNHKTRGIELSINLGDSDDGWFEVTREHEAATTAMQTSQHELRVRIEGLLLTYWDRVH